ncbi:LysR family transcriptional regulator [Halomonas sp. YLGW01]|uniref:LysR family transcriptional regulator n=1 Tax=Halomonas sp. YLGW01 TaxID=2773308 RepID=UPI0017824C01|nr:LysR family transcriptional regulator [Halomonas sp. YLGW01]
MADTDDVLPSLKALSAFETTLRLGSLTAAAKALGATQPAISQRIRGLEGQVGLVLFERSGGGLEPTREALRFYDEIAPALNRIDSATRALRARARSTRPRVLIAANFGFAHLWLLPRLSRLEAAFPQVDIEVLAVDRDDQDHRADIAIHCDRESEPGDLFTPEEVFPVCSPAFAAEHGLEAGDAPARWMELSLLHMDERNSRWIDWREWCALAGVPFEEQGAVFRYNNYPLLINAAQAGKGIALGWDLLVEEALKDGSLIPLAPPIRRESHGYILRTRYAHSALIGEIIRWVTAEIERREPA